MNRILLKSNAKAALRENFSSKMLLFIVPIIIGIIGGGYSFSWRFNHSLDWTAGHTLFTALALGARLVGTLIGILFAIFVTIITAAAIFNYIKIYRGERENPQINNIFIPFHDGTASKIFLMNLVRGLILLVLAFIPIIGWAIGIYLALGWSQATYVLFDQLEKDNYTGVMNVLRASAELMHGFRANYFVFQLSFLGWYILTGITGGFLGFWTIPYTNMARVAYYQELLEQTRF